MSQFPQHRSTIRQDQSTQRTHAPRNARRVPYPFSALVGQDEMKLALLLNAVSPQIAGVLIQGEKGTAKSTAARALQALLPPITVVEQCDFGCDPTDLPSLCEVCTERLEREEALPTHTRPVRLVELPLGATEDRVLGTLDLERAIKDGVRQFEPGLLAAAHRGILYIDEVNLLPDHLVDGLLDAATTGRNVVEREGISFVHPAQFLLIGTMNPEEGDLRPQLLDRFGLSVEVQGLKDLALRTSVVKRRIAFEANASAFAAQWQEAEAILRAQIISARQLLPQVVVPDEMLGLISFICTQVDVEGLRADITIYKAASALAALEERVFVTEQDVQRVAPLALAHRLKRQPSAQSAQPDLDPQTLEKLINNYQPPQQKQMPSDARPAQNSNAHATDPPDPPDSPDPADNSQPADTSQQQPGATNATSDGEAQAPEQIIPPGASAAPIQLSLKQTRMYAPGPKIRAIPQAAQNARAGIASIQRQGPIIAARHPAQPPSALALAPTLRAAALHQQRRRAEHTLQEERRIWLEAWDVLEPVRQQKQGALVLFVVDASGSMAARKRMAAAKGAVLALLQQAYQKRDHVGLIQFRGTKATVLLPPTTSTSLATRALTHLPTGGRTPLAAGLRVAQGVLQMAARRDGQRQRMLVLVTDGRANVAATTTTRGITLSPLEDARAVARELRALSVPSLIIDAEEGPVRMGLAHDLAREMGGSCIQLTTLEATSVTDAVRFALGRA